jgi:hypothetical protein
MSGGEKLSPSMRTLMWEMAQHKHGWRYLPNYWKQTAYALMRRGLATVDTWATKVTVTDEGRAEIEGRWPVSPLILGTYDHQPDGWDLLDDDRKLSAATTDTQNGASDA